jgi:hypothetical protein
MVLLQQSFPVGVEVPSAPQCRHHWIIEPADGPVSLGECRFCHESREFKNSIAEIDPDYRNPGAYSGFGSRDRANVPVE